MGKPLSNDLRLRMVRGVASGKSRRAVAAQFEVAPSTSVRVRARYGATGVLSCVDGPFDARVNIKMLLIVAGCGHVSGLFTRCE